MADEQFFIVNEREAVVTGLMEVRCDGGNAPLGHPVEFMTLANGTVTCKYCGRLYVHEQHPDAQRIRRDGVGAPP